MLLHVLITWLVPMNKTGNCMINIVGKCELWVGEQPSQRKFSPSQTHNNALVRYELA
jgi:hypothetical protein